MQVWNPVLLPKKPSGGAAGPLIRDLGLSGGWALMSKDQKLQVGDVVVFHLRVERPKPREDKATVFKRSRLEVHIFRARDHDAALADPYAFPLDAAGADDEGPAPDGENSNQGAQAA